MPSKPASAASRVGVGGARVDHGGLAGLGGEREEPLEEPSLRVVRRVVAEVVEAGLADCDRLRMVEQPADLGDGVLVGLGRRMRVDAEDREDAVVARRRARARRGSPRPSCRPSRMRVTPAARARSTASSGSSSASRWACVSITQRAPALRPAGRAAATAAIPSAALGGVRGDAVEREVAGLAERGEDARRGLGQVRRDRDGNRDDPVGEVVEDRVELARLRLVLRELPGRA